MDSEWLLDRLDSGYLYWRREESRVKFRYDVEVVEFWPTEQEKACLHWETKEPQPSATAAAFCLAAIALIVGFKWYCQV